MKAKARRAPQQRRPRMEVAAKVRPRDVEASEIDDEADKQDTDKLSVVRAPLSPSVSAGQGWGVGLGRHRRLEQLWGQDPGTGSLHPAVLP